MFRRGLIAFTVLLVLLPSGTSHAQSGPSVGIRLVDAPVGRQEDPRAHSYIVDHVKQGTTITRHVEVSSTDTKPVQIALYVAAAEVKNGAFQFGDGRAQNDLTDWSKVDPGSVTIPPKSAVQAAVTIAVPANAPSGEQYGVIWAELPGSGGAANVVNRVGIRIYLSVGEGSEPKSDFKIDALVAKKDDKGVPIVETRITNTGGRAIDLSGTLVLANGPGGLTTKPYPVEVGTTLGPKQSAPARIVLDKSLPDGPWDATVTIKSGRLGKTATATLTFPSKAGAAAKPVKAKSNDKKTLVPIALALLLLVAIATAVIYRRRKRAAERASS